MQALHKPKWAGLLQPKTTRTLCWFWESGKARCCRQKLPNKLAIFLFKNLKFNLARPQAPTHILIHPSVFKEKPKIYKHSTSNRQQFYLARPEPLNFDRYTVSSFQRVRSGIQRQKTQSKWVPRTTIPQPFKMTLRYF